MCFWVDVCLNQSAFLQHLKSHKLQENLAFSAFSMVYNMEIKKTPKASANKNKKILSSQNENYFFGDQTLNFFYRHKFDFFQHRF